ncbi:MULTISPECIES: hypothetical protein [unclassified Moorena]|uniref:hypothetical protein n=1 Tax=unclassified Moorena TaxID=2683338 RepID=UPI0013FE8A13|nr:MULTISPECIES: hypothetical protein [unclassified Moorena]NEO16011.1 hypothetical protein [Moorena sp. SIO3E8]NEQ03048.1 hypothetical protein [Moorena sp. SIO3F7]
MGIVPARKLKRARCPFHQDARSTKMSMARQDARSTKMPMARQDAHATKLLKSSRIYGTPKFVHHFFENRSLYN